jgi:hypothetical protein
VAVAGAAALGGCGGSGASTEQRPPAARVCDRSLQAAAGALRAPAHLRVISAAPADIVCRVSGAGRRIEVEAQASTQAWVQYETEQVHYAQAYGPGSVHDRHEMPRNVSGVGDQAFWVPAERQLYTTNGSQSRAGSYLTVKVGGRARGGVSDLALAGAVARAALPVAPRGANPGPPPS